MEKAVNKFWVQIFKNIKIKIENYFVLDLMFCFVCNNIVSKVL